MLERATIWRDERQRETKRTEWLSVRIASNDKGIAHVINDLSNPRLCDPKAGALPGCATPRLEYLEFHLSQQAFGLGERFGTMADRIFLIRRQLRQGLP